MKQVRNNNQGWHGYMISSGQGLHSALSLGLLRSSGRRHSWSSLSSISKCQTAANPRDRRILSIVLFGHVIVAAVEVQPWQHPCSGSYRSCDWPGLI